MPLKGTPFELRRDIMRNATAEQLYNKLSTNVSSNGRTAGRNVCITKESTLKGIRVSNVKINNCIFTDQRSHTFCTALVHSLQMKNFIDNYSNGASQEVGMHVLFQ